MSSLVMEIEDYTLSAGAPLPVSRKATYFLLMTGNDVDVEFSYRGSRIGGGKGLQGGDAVGPLSQPYDQVTLTSATAQTVKIATSSDPVTITRLSGTVRVDGVIETAADFSRVQQETAYEGGISKSATSGEYSYVQLWNPAASGKDMVVTGLFVRGPTVSDAVSLWLTDQELDAGFNGYGSRQAVNMRLQNPVKVSAGNVMRGGSLAASAALANSAGVAVGTLLSGWVDLKQPLVIAPGAGVAVQSDAVNQEVALHAIYFEV